MAELKGVNLRQWVPTATAMRMLKVTKQRVYQLRKAGLVRSVVIDGTIMISLQSIEERIVWLRHQEEMYSDIR